MTIPEQIGFDSALVVQGSFGIEESVRIEILGRTVRIFDGFVEYKDDAWIVLIFRNFRNPGSTKPSDKFTISTLTPDLKPIDSATAG